MIALICLFIPAIISVCLREKFIKKSEKIYKIAAEYLILLFAVNGLALLLCEYVFKTTGNLWHKLNTYSDFASKYMLLTAVISVAIPAVEYLVRFKLTFSFTSSSKWVKYLRIAVCIFAVVLFSLSFIRIFDNNFWKDELYTINLIKGSIPKLIEGTAKNVHPPLYYLILKMLCKVFGYTGWVFHLASVIPYGIIMVLALTVIWKRYGKQTSIILITIASLSSFAVKYNVEVRMYSWGALFVLLSFLALHKVLSEEKIINYILFAVFSLAAAYTHYYCLVSVAFFYLILLIRMFNKKADWKKVLITCAATVIAYLPWVFSMSWSKASPDVETFKMTVPTFKECMMSLFSNQFSQKIMILILIAIIISVLYETEILYIGKNNEGKIAIKFDLKNIKITDKFVWCMAGILSIVGTCVVGIVLSELIKPMFMLRYLYPASVIAWLLLGVFISKLKGKNIYTIALFIFMMITFIPKYKETYVIEAEANSKIESTLEVLEVIGKDDIILSNNGNITYTINSYYFSKNECKTVNPSKIPELDSDKCYWMVFNAKIGYDINRQLKQKGFTSEEILLEGRIGTNTVYVYKVESN